MAQPQLEFWFDFGSTYSYPASQRIQALAREAEVQVRFRPFMLGAIFKAQGWSTSPFNLYPAKGRYMWRDLARICTELSLPLVRPEPFPQNSLLAARVAVAAADEAWLGDYCVQVFREAFAHGRPIADAGIIQSVVERFATDALRFLELAQTAEIKERLRAETERAGEMGIFGAPTFVAADGELFWGNDRLESALAWARSTHAAQRS
ncbi:2-hydroxychromene-2-carboxylate isomerase [Hyphomicrobium sp.]|uniref:2-hydroxychromene-2-carboxylate isomerase n=1 Tax=Hyphomicrobium sp. TaxID=82 RepID=UPI0025C2DBD1|nr:2-hydroxychromene-2-carboxylate isomerase [Hyphomicrobium sp.]MCC7252452.1 2-hydroxychromene-2-carboxylate isomerase [Hyphomicrobium sp.]